jgi:hypothetical protein
VLGDGTGSLCCSCFLSLEPQLVYHYTFKPLRKALRGALSSAPLRMELPHETRCTAVCQVFVVISPLVPSPSKHFSSTIVFIQCLLPRIRTNGKHTWGMSTISGSSWQAFPWKRRVRIAQIPALNSLRSTISSWVVCWVVECAESLVDQNSVVPLLPRTPRILTAPLFRECLAKPIKR